MCVVLKGEVNVEKVQVGLEMVQVSLEKVSPTISKGKREHSAAYNATTKNAH